MEMLPKHLPHKKKVKSVKALPFAPKSIRFLDQVMLMLTRVIFKVIMKMMKNCDNGVNNISRW